MQPATEIQRRTVRPSAKGKAATAAPLLPPVFTPGLAPIDETKYPPAIFGKLPASFVLANQHITMLRFWQQRALKAADEAANGGGKVDENLTHAMGIANNINAAIRAYKATCASDVALQMLAIVDWLDAMGCSEEIDQELTVAEFRDMASALRKATALPQPTKKVGALRRGGKLTRAGLLHRYHAFLVGELQTVSWNLYGSRDYASRMIPIDDAVTVRVDANFKNGKFAPSRSRKPSYFFDESRLPQRARSVLRSLKIDTEKAGDR